MEINKSEINKVLDEIFTYSNKLKKAGLEYAQHLRKAGLDYEVIDIIIKLMFLGCPSITINTKDGRTEDGKLSESQLNTINILKENGFEISELGDKNTLAINTYFKNLQDNANNCLKSKEI